MSYVHLRVPGTNTLLHVDPVVEYERVQLFTPLLRKYGEVFPHVAFDGSYEAKPITARCFDAAMELAHRTGWRYVEGFLVMSTPHLSDSIFPIGHGWCVRPDGTVADPTAWERLGTPTAQYLGIPIKVDYSDRWKSLTGYYGCMDGYFDGLTVDRNVGIYADPPALWLDAPLKGSP